MLFVFLSEKDLTSRPKKFNPARACFINPLRLVENEWLVWILSDPRLVSVVEFSASRDEHVDARAERCLEREEDAGGTHFADRSQPTAQLQMYIYMGVTKVVSSNGCIMKLHWMLHLKTIWKHTWADAAPWITWSEFGICKLTSFIISVQMFDGEILKFRF